VKDVVRGVAPATRIQPSKGWIGLGLRDLWKYRELLYFFVWRDLRVRYKQTAFGAAWAIIQPFLTMLVFSLFFGRLAGVPSDGLPYPVFAFAALVPWTYFANVVIRAANTVVDQSSMISKVYFPRLLLPATPLVGELLDLGIGLLVLGGVMLFYGLVPPVQVVLLPLFLLLAVAAALAVGIWLASLNALYRDVRYVVPFLVQLWLFATPVVYPSSLVPDPWRVLYGLNPMAGVIEGFRWSLLGAGQPPGPFVAVSVAVVAALLAGGLAYFRRTERVFADVV
jgi:lipopolysaccharide transport system permease protein